MCVAKTGGRVGDWRRRSVGSAYLLLPVSIGSASLVAEPKLVSSPRHLARNERISRITRSCTVHIRGYETYQAGAAAGDGLETACNRSIGIYEYSPIVPYSHSLLHRFHPKPRRWRALARWRRIFFSTQFRMYEKHRLEFPMAKYRTQPLKIGLIFSINHQWAASGSGRSL